MATFTWDGAAGRYGAARHWDLNGVPQAGDTGVITAGRVTIRHADAGATLSLGGPDASEQPALRLVGASLAALAMPDILPAQPYTDASSPAAYGTVEVRGHSSIGSITIGNYANMDRAPPPYGHAPLSAPDTLTLQLDKGAQLDTSFDVKWGSSMTVNGGGNASLNVLGGTIEGGNVTINSALAGNGTILMTNGETQYFGAASSGSLELGGPVGTGETIDIRMGSLLIDKPDSFMGSLHLWPEENPSSDAGSYGPQSVTLDGITATSYAFDDPTHELLLYNNDQVVDQVHFTPDITSGSFGPTYASNISVQQTSAGVYLRGEYNGATNPVIPLHA